MTAATTPLLGITEIDPNQTSKVVSMNAAIEALEAGSIGYAAVAMTDANKTMSTAEMTHAVIKITGAITAARNIVVPTLARSFVFQNGTTGGFPLTIKTSGGAGIALGVGEKAALTCDGTDVVREAAERVALLVVVGDETTTITTGTAKATFRAPYPFSLSAIRTSVNTVSSSGLPTTNVKKNGSTVFTTKSTIDVSEKTSVTAATPSVLTANPVAVADDDEFTIDIDVAGTGAKGLKVWLLGWRPLT